MNTRELTPPRLEEFDGWRLEECTTYGIFNGSYVVTKPDPRWPDDPEERKIVCRFPTGMGRYSEQYADARLVELAPIIYDVIKGIKELARYRNGAFNADIVRLCEAVIEKVKGETVC